MRLGGQMVCNGWICFCGAGDEGAGTREEGKGKRVRFLADCRRMLVDRSLGLVVGRSGWVHAVPPGRLLFFGGCSQRLALGYYRARLRRFGLGLGEVFDSGDIPARATSGHGQIGPGAHLGRGHILRFQGAPVHVAEAGILGMGRC